MKIFTVSLFCLILAACETQSNKMTYAQSQRVQWQQKAKAGDAEAQYRLGKAYCCGDQGFFDTEQAVIWWCKAARQGHSKARQALNARKRQKSCPANL